MDDDIVLVNKVFDYKYQINFEIYLINTYVVDKLYNVIITSANYNVI